jgi:hypothetical protein
MTALLLQELIKARQARNKKQNGFWGEFKSPNCQVIMKVTHVVCKRNREIISGVVSEGLSMWFLWNKQASSLVFVSESKE